MVSADLGLQGDVLAPQEDLDHFLHAFRRQLEDSDVSAARQAQIGRIFSENLQQTTRVTLTAWRALPFLCEIAAERIANLPAASETDAKLSLVETQRALRLAGLPADETTALEVMRANVKLPSPPQPLPINELARICTTVEEAEDLLNDPECSPRTLLELARSPYLEIAESVVRAERRLPSAAVAQLAGREHPQHVRLSAIKRSEMPRTELFKILADDPDQVMQLEVRFVLGLPVP